MLVLSGDGTLTSSFAKSRVSSNENKTKIEKISAQVEDKLINDEEYSVKITILSQLLLEQKENLYKNDLYKILAQIIKQGQKEGSAWTQTVMPVRFRSGTQARRCSLFFHRI